MLAQMCELSMTKDSTLYRFVHGALPLKLNGNLLQYRWNGRVGAITLDSKLVSNELFERLSAEGLTYVDLTRGGLLPLLRSGLVDTATPWEAGGMRQLLSSPGLGRLRQIQLVVGSTIPDLNLEELEPLNSSLSAFSQAPVAELAMRSSVNSTCILITDSYDSLEVRNVGRDFFQAGSRWIPVLLDGTRVSIGPLFGDEKFRHCFACFRARLASSLSLNRLGVSQTPEFLIPIILRWVGLRLMFVLAGETDHNPSRSISFFDPVNAECSVENYLPAPLCEMCE